MDKNEIKNNFTYHKPTEDMESCIKDLRYLFEELAEHINIYVPEGREKALAITKIEEAMMWANAGIVRKGEINNG
jgi:hypothetical protein